MAVYPDVILEVPATIPFNIETEWRTLMSRWETTGQEKRNLRWTVPRRKVTLEYIGRTASEASEISIFFDQMNGRFQAFSFFCPYSETYGKEYIGVVKTSETIFKLPSKGATNYALYKNNTFLSGGEYIFYSGGATDGGDKMSLNFSPSAGDRFTWTFTGQLKITCRFANDMAAYSRIKLLSQFTIELQGLQHEPF